MTEPFLIVIYAQNLEPSLAFYQAIGLSFVAEQHGSGPLHYACEYKNLVMELYPAKNPDDVSTHNTMIGFKVDSIEETLSTLRSLGTQPKSPPKDSSWGRWVNVIDPDGRTVQLVEKERQI